MSASASARRKPSPTRHRTPPASASHCRGETKYPHLPRLASPRLAVTTITLLPRRGGRSPPPPPPPPPPSSAPPLSLLGGNPQFIPSPQTRSLPKTNPTPELNLPPLSAAAIPPSLPHKISLLRRTNSPAALFRV
uniref:Uncharacterized protein n=1 Tax=Oryza punctata TaxID=4537 RepID=A0A0E0KWT1_ORYPU